MIFSSRCDDFAITESFVEQMGAVPLDDFCFGVFDLR